MTLSGLRGIIQSIEPALSKDAIQNIFSEILLEFKAYLGMETINKDIRLILTKQNRQSLTINFKELHFFNLGIQQLINYLTDIFTNYPF
ncbi:MAG: hypothetical protein ACFFCI_22920 [Promethearchaeota archaeon]